MGAKKRSANRKKTIIAFYVTLISVIVLAVSSYAWMSLSSSPVVSDMSMTLVTDNVLEIAPDADGAPGEWGSILDLAGLLKDANALRPVSLSSEELAFQIANYGKDGRIKSLETVRLTDQNSSAHDTSVAADTEALQKLQGSIITYTFYMRTESTDCMISLADPVPVDSATPEMEGSGCFAIGEPVWNEEITAHEENGKGAQNAIRIGFLVEGRTYQNNDGETVKDPDIFVIYEPNADAGRDVDGENVTYNGAYKIIRQQTSTFEEEEIPLIDSVLYNQGDFMKDENGKIDTDLFQLYAGEERKITLFIWLEGEDRDCTNAISEGKLLMNIQFTTAQHKGEPIYHD